jgi:energy-coupling factor transport system permease protein
MKRVNRPSRSVRVTLCENSPLRRMDPRVKLVFVMLVSLAVMLPIERLVVVMAFYLLLLLWAGLFSEMLFQVYRLKWVLVLLFIIDWWFVSIDLAILVTVRLVLLAGVFTVFFSTTTPGELGLALEYLHIPYRFAFSINLVLQSLGLIQDELNAIHEAQKSRGIIPAPDSLHKLVRQIGDLVALTVPAIVLVTRRAWATTEAAYARGFDSPKRTPYRQLNMARRDWIFIAGSSIVVFGLLLWR